MGDQSVAPDAADLPSSAGATTLHVWALVAGALSARLEDAAIFPRKQVPTPL